MLHRKIKLYFSLLIIVLPCFFLEGTNKNPIKKKVNTADFILPFKIKQDINAKCPESVLKNIICTKLEIKSTDVKYVKYKGNYHLKGLNKALIFKVKLSYNLPAAIHYSYVLIVDNITHNAYLFELDIIEPIKVDKNSNIYYFAGRYKNRYGYGYFKIFEFENNIMYNVFISDEAVSNYSNDCISYENDDLKLQNIDLNNDGYLDTRFIGVKNYYCNGREQFGRDERKPIKSEKITINYYFNNTNLSWQKTHQY